VALPELLKRGYSEKLALGSLATAGTLGILIPPSITMVVYAVAADRVDHPHLPGRLPARLPADGAVHRIHLWWAMPQPVEGAVADPPTS
jgi:TRAP-type C4-dicarboxylate transport system permease large subunit